MANAETIKQKLDRIANEFQEKINSGEIQTFGNNSNGFPIVVKSGTKLQLKQDPSVVAIAAEDCTTTARITYNTAWKERNFKKGSQETMHTYTLLNIFDIVK